MTCTRIRTMLSAYHDDALSLEDRARIRRHLAACDDCRETLDAYHGLYTALRTTVAPVPLDLRRNVYARLAEVEVQRGQRLPMVGSMFLGGLRAAGGTAGVVAVLAALVAAAMRFGIGQPSPAGVASPAEQRVEAAHALTAVSGVVGAAGVSRGTAPLPRAVQTAVAPLQGLAAGVVWQPGHMHVGASQVAVDGRLVHLSRLGQPQSIVPFHANVAMGAQTPVVSQIAYGTPSPVPTIPPGDGAVYLHLDTACVFITGCGNSPAEVTYHPLEPWGRAQTLVTPVAQPTQLFTGLNASVDGDRVAYSALSPRDADSGIFQFDTAAPALQHVFALPDINPLTRAGVHRYVKQVYAATDGRLFFAVVNGESASIAITTTGPYATATLKSIGQPTMDYVMSPDRRRIAWTQRPRKDFFGRLQIADLDSHPVTHTVAALGSRPVWSADGQHALFLAEASSNGGAALTLWSATTGRTQTLVAPPSGGAFISTYAWAPGGRFFVYVVTSLGPDGTSAVRVGDTVTGLTWPSFQQRYIGAIAWVHGRALNTLHARVAAPTPTVARSRARQATTGAVPAAASQPASADSSATPSATLRGFYQAIDRHDFARAYAYLAASDGRTLAQFSKGYADTQTDSLVQVQPAPYLTAAKAHRLTCVGVALVARHWNGKVFRFGGWYLLQSATGQNPYVGGWRIVVRGSHIVANGRATVPPQSACRPAAAGTVAA